MFQMKLSHWALVAVGTLSAAPAIAQDDLGRSRPTSQSYADEILLVSHCEDACDSCCPMDDVPCDSIDSCDGGGCDGVGCDGCATGCDDGPAKLGFLDCLKNMELCSDGCGKPALTLSAGGALRYRFYNEDNRLRPTNVPGDFQSNYSQWRFTPYVEANYKDRIVAHLEAIDAPTFGNEIQQLPIDEDRTDLLEYYIDVKLLKSDAGTLGTKVGRQRILYGDQHAVSPLAWSNTFRVFEGYKAYWKGENWDVDALIDMKSVNGPAGAPFLPQNANRPDQSRSLHGIYSTYRGLDKGNLDLYWLWSDEKEPAANITDGDRHTFGARWYHTNPIKNECDKIVRTWKYDVQGAYQVGDDIIGIHNGGAESDVEAGFLNLTASHTWNTATWTPTLTGLFYYGSGDKNLNDGTIDTVYTLYPLGHAYWGLADQFSGQNLIDYSLAMTMKPSKKLTLLTAFHYFDKAEAADAVYNIANVALGPTAGTGKHIGTEVDLVATYALKENITLQGGYFWFFYGDAVNNAGAFARDDSDTFYFLANYTF